MFHYCTVFWVSHFNVYTVLLNSVNIASCETEQCKFLAVLQLLTSQLLACLFSSSLLRVGDHFMYQQSPLHCCLSLANWEHSTSVLFDQSLISSVHLHLTSACLVFSSHWVFIPVFQCTGFCWFVAQFLQPTAKTVLTMLLSVLYKKAFSAISHTIMFVLYQWLYDTIIFSFSSTSQRSKPT